MSEPPILTARDGDVFTITFNRPDRLNAFGADTFLPMQAALDEAEASCARALILTGAGRAFHSGADLQGDTSAIGDMSAHLEATFNPLVTRLANLPMPVVAAINGPCAGAGVGIALACDFVLTARSAYLLLAFVNIGLVPDAGVSWLLPRRVGRQRANALMMLGERLSAETAEAWGLIHRVVDDEALMPEAKALAARLAAGPTGAYARMKAVLNESAGVDLSATLALEAEAQGECGRSADFMEGVSAFLQKRPPRFTGR